MKKFIIAIALVLAPMASFAETAKISVNGLVCAFCAKGIENTFSKREEVHHVNVNLDDKLVTLGFNEGKTISDKEVETLLKDSGYTVTNIVRE